MDIAFTDDVQEILRSIGWSEDRQFEIVDWIDELRAGFEILDNGVATLKLLGGFTTQMRIAQTDCLL
ncbi:MAG: SUKH-3 domain-containing protein [Pirellulaceae bacterium]